MFLKPIRRLSSATSIAEIALTALVLWIFWAFLISLNPRLGTSVLSFTSGSSSAVKAKPPPRFDISTAEAGLIELTAEHFIDYPIQKPYRTRFGELGGRLRTLREWTELAGHAAPGPQRERLLNATEAVVASAFPFLRKNQTSHTPLADLRSQFTAPRGIVIPTGSKTFRYACHLVVGLRRVFKTTLPIQIVYAGDWDLPEVKRQQMASLAGEDEDGGEIEFLNIMDVFDDTTLKLAHGGWAIKAFAALASKFNEVILLDADAVFLQDPEVLLKQKAYVDNGALFFHDRLLWQFDFKDRHDWWHSQVKHSGPQLNKSRVWTEMFAEEQDSGVVVLNKSRLDVLLGLLHVAWQNTAAVRDEVTYKLTYGDKEAWWFGFELAGAAYAFEKHYGGIVGWAQNRTGITAESIHKQKVCSFVIAHADENERLLWYNGGLLKNKIMNMKTFEVPTHWMVDGDWEKGSRKADMSCMKNTPTMDLAAEEKEILRRSIEEAQRIDEDLHLIYGH